MTVYENTTQWQLLIDHHWNSATVTLHINFGLTSPIKYTKGILGRPAVHLCHTKIYNWIFANMQVSRT